MHMSHIHMLESMYLQHLRQHFACTRHASMTVKTKTDHSHAWLYAYLTDIY